MSKQMVEQRIDPENREGPDFHALRALHRFEDVPPGEKRSAIMEATFRNLGAHEGEADSMRARLLRTLDPLEGRLSPEQQRLLDMLKKQADFAASVWTERFPVPNAPARDCLVEGARRWLAILPGETIDGLNLQCPETARLVMVPKDLSVPELAKLIGGGVLWHEGRILWHEGWDRVRAPEWLCGITDGQKNMPFDPSIFYVNPEAPEGQRTKRTKEEMVAEYKRRFCERGLSLMPQHGYVPAVAEALARESVLDRESFTFFKRPPNSILLPFGIWDDGQLKLAGDDRNDDYFRMSLRCRPWVEGEMVF